MVRSNKSLASYETRDLYYLSNESHKHQNNNIEGASFFNQEKR
jgi:hypothetical protein